MYWHITVGEKNGFILKNGNSSLLNVSFLALKKKSIDDVFLMGSKDSALKISRFMNKRIVPGKEKTAKKYA